MVVRLPGYVPPTKKGRKRTVSFDVIKPDDLHAEPGLYTHAFSAPTDGKRLVIISGQLGIRQDGSIHEDFEGPFPQTYDNLRTVLKTAGGPGGPYFAAHVPVPRRIAGGVSHAAQGALPEDVPVGQLSAQQAAGRHAVVPARPAAGDRRHRAGRESQRRIGTRLERGAHERH